MSEYVFNAASNDAQNGGLHAATALAVTLVQTLAELDGRLTGPARALKLPQNPWDLVFTQDAHDRSVSLGEIVNGFYDSGETRELAAFFDAMQCYAPAVERLDDSAIDAILRLSPARAMPGFECVYDAVCEAGYDAMQCAVTGGILVSLAHSKWDFDQASIVCESDPVAFDHASRPSHVDAIMHRKQEYLRASVRRQNFEAVRHQAFPSLAWGQDIPGQITKFPAEYLELAFARLASLDDIVRRWQASGSAEPEPGSIVFRNESALTMDNYGSMRSFRSASGDMRTYETHVWIDRGNRIHLILDRPTRSIEIGYVGPHLKTWKY